MINLYAYTYPATMHKFPGFILTKVGDSHRDVNVRINEQGGAAENESKVKIGDWPNCHRIKRDHDLHEVLKAKGLYHYGDHKGTEWFKIPGANAKEAFAFLDKEITKLEGKKSRANVVLRDAQEKALSAAMAIIDSTNGNANIIANLCPRFGKTIWALSLFNRVSEKYGKRVMLLPAYWLAVHSSFINELDRFNDFSDIVQVDMASDDAEETALAALMNGNRVVIPISLCGAVEEWCDKHEWVQRLSRDDLFVFADEGDFGTHADNQRAKIDFILSGEDNETLIAVYASGTNVQRLAMCSKRIDGVIHTAYSQLENAQEAGIIKRRFFSTNVDALKQVVEQMDVKVMPSWTKIWEKPQGNKAFIGKLFQSLVGDDTLRTELNLSNIADESIDCFMLLVSADKAPMEQIAAIAARNIPDWHVKVLNGNYTTNKKAEAETKKEIEEARIAGKKGVMIIANQMGSRSYSVSEIQATVIAYDRGGMDATTQKVSRCLTPGKTFDGTMKTSGCIVDLSFDPNRSEIIERLVLEEIIQVQKAEDITFIEATRFVLSCIDMHKLADYGNMVEVSESDMFKMYTDSDIMLKVANVAVDIRSAIQSGVFKIFSKVNAGGGTAVDKKAIVGEGVVNSIKAKEAAQGTTLSNAEARNAEKIINEAIIALNNSATSIFFLANEGDSYRECVEAIIRSPANDAEFTRIFGVPGVDVITLLDKGALPENFLDAIFANSKSFERDV